MAKISTPLDVYKLMNEQLKLAASQELTYSILRSICGQDY